MQEELRQRITAATVALHAEKGPASTTYQDIARKADVAVPSVYKHFPDESALFSACTAHAAKSAPTPSREKLLMLSRADDRVRALVEMRCELNKYFHPWLRWGGEHTIPEVAAFIKADAAATRDLFRLALEPKFKGGPIPPELVNISLVLLDYHSWSRLATGEKLSQKKTIAQISEAILKLIDR